MALLLLGADPVEFVLQNLARLRLLPGTLLRRPGPPFLLGEAIFVLGSLLLKLPGQLRDPLPPQVVADPEGDQEGEDSNDPMGHDAHGSLLGRASCMSRPTIESQVAVAGSRGRESSQSIQRRLGQAAPTVSRCSWQGTHRVAVGRTSSLRRGMRSPQTRQRP